MDPILLASRFKSHRNVVQGILDQLFPYSQDAPDRVLPQAEWLQDALQSDSHQLRLLTRAALWPTDLAGLCRDLAQRLETALGIGESLDLNLPPQSYLVLTDGPRVVDILQSMVCANDQPYGTPTRLTVLEKQGRPSVTISTIPYGGTSRTPVASVATTRDALSSSNPRVPRRITGLNLSQEDFVRALGLCRIECSIPGKRLELSFTPSPARPPPPDPVEEVSAPLETALARLADAQEELDGVVTRIRTFRTGGEFKDGLGRLRFGLENARRELDAAALIIESGTHDRPVVLSIKDIVREVVAGQKDRLRRVQVRCHVDGSLRLPQAWILRATVASEVARLLSTSLDVGEGPREMWFHVTLNEGENAFRVELTESEPELDSDAGEPHQLPTAAEAMGPDSAPPRGRFHGAVQFEDVIGKGLISLVPRVTSLCAAAQDALRAYKCQLLSGQEGDLAYLLLAVQQQLDSVLEGAHFPRCLMTPARSLPWQAGKLHRLDPAFEQEVASAWQGFPVQLLEPICTRLIRGEVERPTYAQMALLLWVFGRAWTYDETRIANPLGLHGLDEASLATLGTLLCHLDQSETEPPHYIQRLCFRALNVLVDLAARSPDAH